MIYPSRVAVTCALRVTLRVWLVVSSLIALTACEHDATTGPSTLHAAPAAVAPQEHRRVPLPAPRDSVARTERAWWNQSNLIDALSLTSDQRAKMDTLLERSWETQRSERERLRDQHRQLKDALDAGNWEAARAASAAAADGAAAALRAQTDLQIDVLTVLDTNQQRRVREQYRQLLRQTSGLGRLRGKARRPVAAPPG